jgi:hypothetical protein
VRDKTWWRDRAILEEILCGVFLCAGFIANASGAYTWAHVLWGKAAWDMACAQVCGFMAGPPGKKGGDHA